MWGKDQVSGLRDFGKQHVGRGDFLEAASFLVAAGSMVSNRPLPRALGIMKVRSNWHGPSGMVLQRREKVFFHHKD